MTNILEDKDLPVHHISHGIPEEPLFGDFAENSEPLFLVDVADLIQRAEFANINAIHGGLLAPFEHLQITCNGQSTTMLEIIQDASGNGSRSRTDIRFGHGSNGEVYLMNKKMVGFAVSPPQRSHPAIIISMAWSIQWIWHLGKKISVCGTIRTETAIRTSDFLIWQRNLSSTALGCVAVSDPATAF